MWLPMSTRFISEGNPMKRQSAAGTHQARAYESLITALKQARIKKGWSQYELAKKSGVAHTTIARIEAMEYQPKLETLLRLADALGLYLNIVEAEQPSGSTPEMEKKRGESV